MISSTMGMDRRVSVTDQMEILCLSQAEPGTWKGECGTGYSLELQNRFIKTAAPFHVADVDGNMIELLEFHKASTLRRMGTTCQVG